LWESVLSLSYYEKHDIAHVSVPESSGKQGRPRFPREDENEQVREKKEGGCLSYYAGNYQHETSSIASFPDLAGESRGDQSPFFLSY
jgi:hypothetical protein